MMVFGVAIERAHQPVDASGVLANDLHSARAREMARRQFLTHRVEPRACGLPGPPAASELGVKRILVARNRALCDGGGLAGS